MEHEIFLSVDGLSKSYGSTRVVDQVSFSVFRGGHFGPVLLIGILSSFSMVSVSLVVASFLNTVFDVLTVGCFPFFILMFFSGAMFPLPKLNMFSILGHPLGITDIRFEILMIVVLTLIYFLAGLLLYQKRKLSKA
ncbi:P-loop NTPase family protein [Paenibacillus phocaensis]|uniref:hypothetical protein n=1 Tax=Paenibacillus phocaensis TaxID=1776378 RepID=UPI000839D448|nr:hypothetical protein [Paenibacillus phocaensis]